MVEHFINSVRKIPVSEKISKTIKILRFDFVSLNLNSGNLNSFDFIFLNKINKGYIMLNKRNIFQSRGILNKLRRTPKLINMPKPRPIIRSVNEYF